MPTTPQPNPTVARRELATILRQAREEHKRSLDELAKRLDVSPAQASRLDSGARGYPLQKVENLADWYGFPEPVRHRIMVLATESHRRAWWQQVDLNPAYRSLIGMEQAATSISEFAGSVVPGLLQTADYARVVAANSDVEVSDEQIERAVSVRMRRQKILEGLRTPALVVVIDEAALARGPRKPAVRRAQLEYLYEAAERPRITIQVLAFRFGLYMRVSSHFILVARGGADPDFVYSEETLDNSEQTSTGALARYRRLWQEMRAIALDPADSRKMIAKYRDDVS
jgi:transcriptional regulator with XRE-family HTH domain